MIFNPPEANSSAGNSGRAQARLNMKELMPVFVAQLRELLGVPHVVSTAVVQCAVCGCRVSMHPVATILDSFSDEKLRSHY